VAEDGDPAPGQPLEATVRQGLPHLGEPPAELRPEEDEVRLRPHGRAFDRLELDFLDPELGGDLGGVPAGRRRGALDDEPA
jgi:hypothetical protein